MVGLLVMMEDWLHKHTIKLARCITKRCGCQEVFKKRTRYNAVLGPFYLNPFAHKAYLSPLNTRDKKDSEEKRIIINMSFPKGNSINNGIKKDSYLDEQIYLKYPTVDKLVEIGKKKGKGCMLIK